MLVVRCRPKQSRVYNDSELIVTDPDRVRLTSGQLAKTKREVAEGKEPEIPAKIYIAESVVSVGSPGDAHSQIFNAD